MRKWFRIIFWILLLAGGVVLCAVRWQAWFGMPAEPEWTEDTIHYTFQHPTPSDSDSVITFLVLGDIHNGLIGDEYDTLAARVPQTDIVLQTGDWLERGQFYYYQLLLREWTGSALSGKPVIACPGNHEYSKGLLRTVSPVWEEAFGPASNYYLDFPQMRLILLDTNPMVRLVNLTRTLTWLRETMNTAGNRYIVVMMHHPVLSPAKGRFNPHLYAAFRYALSQTDLVLAGHDHSYMRHGPFVVLNTAGKPKTQHLGFPAEATDSLATYGVLQVNDELTFKAYRLGDGALIDSLYVKHD